MYFLTRCICHHVHRSIFRGSVENTNQNGDQNGISKTDIKPSMACDILKEKYWQEMEHTETR